MVVPVDVERYMLAAGQNSLMISFALHACSKEARLPPSHQLFKALSCLGLSQLRAFAKVGVTQEEEAYKFR